MKAYIYFRLIELKLFFFEKALHYGVKAVIWKGHIPLFEITEMLLDKAHFSSPKFSFVAFNSNICISIPVKRNLSLSVKQTEKGNQIVAMCLYKTMRDKNKMKSFWTLTKTICEEYCCQEEDAGQFLGLLLITSVSSAEHSIVCKKERSLSGAHRGFEWA